MTKKYVLKAYVSTKYIGSEDTDEWELDEMDVEMLEGMSQDEMDAWAWENGGEEMCHQMVDMGACIEVIDE